MKLIGSDYDGTLNYGGFDDAKRDALTRWNAAGNAFAIVSGRGLCDLLRIHKETALCYRYCVADNGAVVAHVDGRVIADTRCESALIRPLIETMFANGSPWCDIHTDVIYRVFPKTFDGMADNECTLATLPPVAYFTQVSTMLPDIDKAAAVTAVLRTTFNSQLNPMQNGTCIDVVRHDANKAMGLRALAQHLGIAESDVIAVGDNMNDTDMIAAFYSYAMENGIDSIKSLADHITPSVTALIERELEQ